MTKEDPNTQEDPILEAEGETLETKPAEEDPEIDEATEREGEAEGGRGEGSGSEPAEGAEPESEAEEESELETVKTELDRLRDQHLRLAAEFQNHKKRASAELTGIWTRARADLVQSLVEGLDDLQRVSKFTCEDTTVEALIEGVDLVERNLLKALTEAGLEVLDPIGERFDPNTMEAMMRVPTEEEGQDGTVHQVFQKGYMFKEQLVRPARVSVYMDDD
jgi:molecular chaperone GrpE